MAITRIKCNNKKLFWNPVLLSLFRVQGWGKPGWSNMSEQSDMSDKSDFTDKLQSHNSENQEGFILIAVLWVCLLLSIFALNMATKSRLQGVQAMHVQERPLQSQLLSSALSIGEHEYRKYRENRGLLEERGEWEAAAGKELELWFPRYEPYRLELQDMSLGVRVVNTRGKLDINSVDVHLLEEVLNVCGVKSASRVSSIANSILDWIDQDDQRRPDGADSDYYLSLSQPYLPKNNAMQDIHELLLVRGVTRDIFYGTADHPGLKHFFSVRGGSEQLDINSAAPETFVLLGDMPEQAVQNLIAKRRDQPVKRISELGEAIPFGYFEQLDRYYTVADPGSIEIQAFRLLDDGDEGLALTRLLN